MSSIGSFEQFDADRSSAGLRLQTLAMCTGPEDGSNPFDHWWLDGFPRAEPVPSTRRLNGRI
jgi:hypothetical protein